MDWRNISGASTGLSLAAIFRYARRELLTLKLENDILKKAAVILGPDSSRVHAMIELVVQKTGGSLRKIHPVLGEARGSFYHVATPTATQVADVEIGDLIEAIFHSDRGSQYSCTAFRKALAKAQSMSAGPPSTTPGPNPSSEPSSSKCSKMVASKMPMMPRPKSSKVATTPGPRLQNSQPVRSPDPLSKLNTKRPKNQSHLRFLARPARVHLDASALHARTSEITSHSKVRHLIIVELEPHN